MIGPSHLLNENGDLSFLLYFSKQCLVENIQRKFQKNSSVNFISEESRKVCMFLSASLGVDYTLKPGEIKKVVMSSRITDQDKHCGYVIHEYSEHKTKHVQGQRP